MLAHCDLQLDQRTPFIPDGSALPGLRDLGPVKQLPVSSTDARPRVRLVKDVLRVGQWKVGVDDKGQPIFWNVTQATLHDLATTFRQMKANGVPVNLCYGHGDPETKVVDARDLIAPIDAALVRGDRLWVASYVTPEQARDLSNPVHQVSIRRVSQYTDGAGRVYREALLHVAVVDLPVVDGQGPFLDLANILDLAADAAQSKGAPNMADAADDTTPDTITAAGTMDAGQLSLWKRALDLLGYPLPDDVSPENAGVVIDALLSVAEEASDPEGDDTETAPGGEPADDVLPDDPSGEMPAMLSNQLKAMQQQIADLSQQLVNANTEKARNAYMAKVLDLATAGHINAAQRAVLETKGEGLNYDLSFLSTYELATVVDLGRTAKGAAKPNAPAVAGAPPKRLSDEEVKAGVEELAKGFKRS